MPPTERKLIAFFKAASLAGTRHTRVGIGDDCAVFSVPRNHEMVITTDFTLEDVHFRRQWHPPQSVGHRCLARGLSDIAAMGATPMLAFLSLAMPGNSGAGVNRTWVKGFMRGLLSLASRNHVELAGGDTAQSPLTICADITVVGSAPKGRALLRSGARPGDSLYVTGELGGSAATLALLLGGAKPRPREHVAHFYPVPRVEAGRFLCERALASAAIDVSDGLSTDLSHLCEQSGVGARVFADKVPVTAAARRSGNPLALALHGGEDYELLFTAPAKAKIPSMIAGVPVTRIGEIFASRDRKMTIVENRREKTLSPRGWEHFR